MEHPEVWSRDKIRQVLHELAKLPDFDCLPLPESILKEYEIPFTPAKALGLNEYLSEYRKTQYKPNDGLTIRESDGILRPVPTALPSELIVCDPNDVEKYLLKDETSSETPSSSPQNLLSHPTEATEIMPPLSSD